jgi:hypothetical protein
MMTIQLTHKATMALRLHAVETLTFKGFTVICCPFKGVIWGKIVSLILTIQFYFFERKKSTFFNQRKMVY